MKSNEVLEELRNKLESGELFKWIGPALIRRRHELVPSDRWSYTNRLMMLFCGTNDARGFRQWETVGRKVKKGAKAIYILGPCLVKRKETNAVGEEVVVEKLIGFKAIPVFRYEDTEGEPILIPEYGPNEAPPLLEVAKAWEVPVVYTPQERPGCYGYTNGQRIVLHTTDPYTFFHELSHVAHAKVLGKPLKGGQHPDQEIPAELSAAALGKLFRVHSTDREKDSLAYAQGYMRDRETRELVAFIEMAGKICEHILSQVPEVAVAA